MNVHKNTVTAFIGPSGCGKSTYIRCFNRMNDLIVGAAVSGKVLYHGANLYEREVDAVEVRRRIGMVFQKPNPFPKSIYDNVAFGPRVLGMKEDLDERVEQCLHQAALWDEVKNRLKESALGLSGGQQQRLCIARALATEPDVILMDEPASALDPIATARIEDLMHELKRAVHDHRRHAQHAAGCPCRGHDRLLQRRGARGRQGAPRHPRRVRPDDEDLHPAGRQADGGLCDWTVRLMRVEFQQSLDGLEASLQEQGAVVLRAVRGAVNALETQDVELCDEVIAFDDEVDDRYHRIEKSIEELLALQAPVAQDLRLVLAVLHNSIHLERIGDQSVTIAKLTKLAAELEPRHDLVEGLREMGDRAEEMVRSALDAFADRDVERARALVELDELIDRTNRRVADKVLSMADSPEQQEWGMRMIVVSRCLERIGDNAVDIGEQTEFVVTGEFHEFSDASH